MSHFGKFDPFDPQRHRWPRYCEQLSHFLKAYKVKNDLVRSTVLTLIGDHAYNVLCDLIAPDSPESKSVEEIFAVLENHFTPKTIARSERFKFRSRKQGVNESITDFVAALRKLSLNCAFDNQLDLHLADQFVFGINSTSIQKRLLTEDDKFSFANLVHIASIAEMTSNDPLFVNSDSINRDITDTRDTAEVFKMNNSQAKQVSSPVARSRPCRHCGSFKHVATVCKYSQAVCNYCKRQGHISTYCFTKKRAADSKKNGGSSSHLVHAADRDLTNDVVEYDMDHLSLFKLNSAKKDKPYMMELIVNDSPVLFEIDTGAAVSIIPWIVIKEKLPNINMIKTGVILRTLNEKIIPMGKVFVDVLFRDKRVNLELFVTKEGSIPLLGRTWINALGILSEIWSSSIFQLASHSLSLDNLLKKYDELFSSTFSFIKGIEAHLFVKEDAPPKFCKARPVPFAFLAPIEAELVKLQAQGIISSIQYSEWAAPIVPIVKKDRSLRICGDYKVGLNPVLLPDKYPLPKIDDIFSKLAGGKIFSKLDLTQAYQQVKMDEQSAKFLTINTHKGLFSVNRLPFGISAAPGIFQKIMDQLFSGMTGVVCYLDDILVSGADVDSHLKNLDAVLQKLKEAGIRLNKGKCEFLKSEIEYLGHVIDVNGIHASNKKIDAILSAPEPKDVGQLRSFLGIVSYYRKFLPNIASTLAPLHSLLGKSVKWFWSSQAKEAFLQVKKAIVSTNVLVHFDPNLPLVLACDASPFGLGAVVSHVFPDKTERPIAFASRSLTVAERNYSQIDKEALAIIFGVKKFHQFLFGRSFTLFTDHKPLTRIFAPDVQVPILAAARIQRWSLILASYQYTIKFRTSRENTNADALSRSPIVSQEKSTAEISEEVFLIHQLDSFPLSHKDIAKESSRDKTFSKILEFARDGWPKISPSKEFSPYFSRADEISIQSGCLLWGLRVLIPLSLRSNLLHELHSHHAGMVKMKMLARSFFWWPNLNDDIEKIARSCSACAVQANNPAKAPLHPWARPAGPWQRLHIDFAGPFLGFNFMVAVDAFSKWPEVAIMRQTTAASTIASLDEMLCRYGYPSHIVTDNGPQFLSAEFHNFCVARGIHHTCSAPYHPASNGQAERFVQILKNFLRKFDQKQCMRKRIVELLFSYRSTPHALTQKTPAELFLGRQLRSRLHLLLPPANAENSSTYLPTASAKARSFSVGEEILSRFFGRGSSTRWISGKIVKKIGPLTYIVKFPDGKLGKRHIDQLLPFQGEMDGKEIVLADSSKHV